MELNLPRDSSYRLKIPRRRTREEAILREFLRPDDAGNGLRVRANPSWSLKEKLERRIIGQPAVMNGMQQLMQKMPRHTVLAAGERGHLPRAF